MAKAKYTDKQRKQAVDIYVEKGRKAAEAETGIPGKTIASWVSRAGRATDAGQKRKAAIEASQDAFTLRKENLKNLFLEEIEAALGDMRKPYDKVIKLGEAELVVNVTPTPTDRAKLATAAGIMFDKLQLATGGPTANNINHTPDLLGIVAAQEAKNAAVKAQVAAEIAAEGNQ